MKRCIGLQSWCLFVTLSVSGMAAQAGSATQPEGDELMISRRSWLDKELSETKYQAQATEVARLLADKKLDSRQLDEITTDIKAEPQRAGAAFATLLNWQKNSDPRLRQGALRGIELTAAASKTVGAALANSAFSEPNGSVRQKAVDLIKTRRDGVALQTLMEHLATSADPEGLGIVDEPKRKAVLGALREIGDKRTFEIVLHFVTMEVHAGYAKAPVVDTKFITNSGDVSNGGVGRTTINLPIELPSLELGGINGQITVPAIADARGALREITGQNFGKDLGRWREWIAEQPAVRK